MNEFLNYGGLDKLLQAIKYFITHRKYLKISLQNSGEEITNRYNGNEEIEMNFRIASEQDINNLFNNEQQQQ